MTRPGWQWPVALYLGAAGALTAVAFGGSSTVRALVVLVFLALCPGMAVVRVIGVGDGWAQLSLALALSFTLDTVVAGVLALMGAWSPSAALIVLVAITVGGAGIELGRRSAAEASA